VDDQHPARDYQCSSHGEVDELHAKNATLRARLRQADPTHAHAMPTESSRRQQMSPAQVHMTVSVAICSWSTARFVRNAWASRGGPVGTASSRVPAGHAAHAPHDRGKAPRREYPVKLVHSHPAREETKDGHTEQASPPTLEITRATVLPEWILVCYAVYGLPTVVAPVHDVPSGSAEVGPKHQVATCTCSYRTSSDGCHVDGALLIGPLPRESQRLGWRAVRSLSNCRLTASFSPLACSDKFDEHSCELQIETTNGIVTALSARMR
jgi:hypothetical protein